MSDPQVPPPAARLPASAFPETRWSRILGGGDRRDLEQLAQAYWRPVRAWLGARLRVDADAAADLAQDAFAWLLETRFLDRADPTRGRFRAFLKTALANFAIARFRHQQADKRGGAVQHHPLTAAEHHADPGAPTPDEALDRAWRRELLERARDALQQELEGSGRAVHFDLFRDWFLLDERTDHKTLAARYGISTTDVSNWLDHGKRRYRAILRQLVRDTVDDEEALAEELHWLFGDERRPR